MEKRCAFWETYIIIVIIFFKILVRRSPLVKGYDNSNRSLEKFNIETEVTGAVCRDVAWWLFERKLNNRLPTNPLKQESESLLD
jgi:hypothetical protein